MWLRLTLRPAIAIWAAVSALVVKYGPKGVEMWPIWTRLLRASDWGGFVRLPRGTEVEAVRLPACDAERVRAANCAARRPGRPLLPRRWLRRVRPRFAPQAGGTDLQGRGRAVFNVGYRLLPRSAITDAIDDGVEAYRKLLEDGIAPERIVFAGDSPVAAFVPRRRRDQVPRTPDAGRDRRDQPVDEPRRDRQGRTPQRPPRRGDPSQDDPLHRRAADPEGDPLEDSLSPVNLDLTGLPPTLIHAGTAEVLEVDALKMASRLNAAGVPVQLKLWEGQVHDFQLIGLDILPEARQAIGEIGEFVQHVTG